MLFGPSSHSLALPQRRLTDFPSATGVAQWLEMHDAGARGRFAARNRRGEMRTQFIAITGFAAMFMAASGVWSAEKTMNLSRNAKSGEDSRLAHSGRWDRSCNSLPVKITFIRQPQNGTAWSVEADEVLPPSTPGSGDTGQCAGKTINGKKIMYRSKPGFRGKDTVVYDSDGNGTIIHTTIAVTVQ
jgi:hypothetical protein